MNNIYESKHYKKLLIIPILLLVVMLYYVPQVKFGIDLRGGILLTAPSTAPIDAIKLQSELSSKFDLEDLNVRTTSGATPGFYIELIGEKSLLKAQDYLEAKDYQRAIDISKKFTGEINVSGDLPTQADTYFSKARENFKNELAIFISQQTGVDRAQFSVNDTGPSLGAYFLNQAKTAIIIAFILIIILIFYYFKTPIVSFAVMQSAAFDAVLGYAALGAFNIPLSLATIAPLLMLIGYSVDTDIMLTDRMLKRKEGTPATRAKGAIATGLTMTGAAIAAMLSLFIVSSYANITVLSHISFVLVVGLVGDIIATWCTNAPVILWHLERKAKKVVS
jgi:preprotein translocase subunit SecF